MAVELVASGGRGLTGLAFDGEGRLYVCGSSDGMIYAVGDGPALVEFASTGGSPMSISFDHRGEMHVCDAALKSVVVVGSDGTIAHVVSDFEGAPLKGPHTAVFSADGELFLTDSGAYGETSLAKPRGSVFSVAPPQASGSSFRLITAVAQGWLARPTGLALNPSESALYVCEQAANRLLRFVQHPVGVFHGAVFHQFSGRLGPVAVVCDHSRAGLLYVARPELPDLAEKGAITVLSSDGVLLRDLESPGPEVTSLALSLDARYLYIAEATSNSIYRMLL